MKKISAIVINYNTPELTQRAIDCLLERANDEVAEIILIDNGSTKPMDQKKFNDPRICYLINEKNLGFAGAANQGLRLAIADVMLLMNSDVLVESGAIKKMIDHLESNDKTGIVGPTMVYPNGVFQVSCGQLFNLLSEFVRLSTLYKYLPGGSLFFPNRFNRNLFIRGGQVGWVSGGCLMLKRQVYEQVGELDEKFFFGIEDVDFCTRTIKAGWQVVYLPDAKVIHYHGFSIGGRRTIERMLWERDNLEYLMQKHWPERIIERKMVKLMHSFKIFILKNLIK